MPGVPFERGKSGNPGGRPSASKEIREMIRERGVELIQGLFDIATDTGESAKNRVAATRELLDRGFGKAVQVHDGDGDGGPIVVKVVQFGGDA